jgi:hypothetical protein
VRPAGELLHHHSLELLLSLLLLLLHLLLLQLQRRRRTTRRPLPSKEAAGHEGWLGLLSRTTRLHAR